MSDSEKKTLRHFYCRDALWQSFEKMSDDFDHGIDDLVNEAMLFFAREKGYVATENQTLSPGRSRQTTALPSVGSSPAWSAPPPPPATFPPTPPPLPRTATPPPLPPPRASAARPAAPSGIPGAAARGGASQVPAPPAPGAGRSETPAPPLYLIFDNRKYRIDKDQFIIGRGSKSSDLPIRDGNISRKHCAVVRRNGAYYIKDLGSTNGIDFNGTRVDNKRIEEGDIYHLCEYPLRFTFA